MGFKNKPFMSPQMYKDLIWPGHKKTIEYAHDHKLPVIMHSCGYIEPFIPYLIDAGLDCLQAMEVKAGMDVLKLKKLYGDKLALFGGLDIRILETNDLNAITSYLETTLPQLKQAGGYLLHTDHSIPNTVDYDTYRHFLSEAKRLGTY
jgi:uroporphyrinogen decarboxylase